MNNSVIITKKAGETPPRSYIERVLRECPTCYGIAMQTKDGDTPVLDVMASASSVTLDKMMETFDAIKDDAAVITFGAMSQDFNKDDDPMPFVFEQASAGDNDPPEKILAVFLEGDFSNYTKVGEGHTETYNFWEDFITPALMEKFEASADLPAFYDKLRASMFKQAVENPMGHRGVAVFVPVIGEPIAYGKNTLGGEYSWGTTSNTFSWTEGGTVAKIGAAVTKAKSRLAAITGTASPAAPAIKTDDNGIHHVKMDTAVVPPKPDVPAGTTPMKPPAKLQGNARNAWIRLFTGIHEGPMPVGHNHADYVVHVPNNLVEFAKRDVQTKDHIKILQKEISKAGKTAPTSAAIAAAHDEAVKINENKETVQDPKKSPSDYLPVSSPDEILKTTHTVTEWATNPKRPAPLDVQRIESKWPAFSATHGITLPNMLGWTIAERKKLCKEFPNEAAQAMGELALWCIDHGALGATPMEIKPDKQVEVPAAPEAPTSPGPATSGKKKSRLAAITGQAA